MAGWFAEQKCTSNFNLSKNWKTPTASVTILFQFGSCGLGPSFSWLTVASQFEQQIWKLLRFPKNQLSWTRMCKRHTSLKEMVWDLWLGSLGYILLLSGSLGDVSGYFPPKKMSDTPGSSASKVALLIVTGPMDEATWIKQEHQPTTYLQVDIQAVHVVHTWINIVPTFKNCIESCTKTGRVCKYMYLYIRVYIIYIYRFVGEECVAAWKFPAPKTCSTAFTSSFKAADICRTSCYICQLF